jgi:fatty acid synthase, animal type
MFCNYIKSRIKDDTLRDDVRGFILTSDSSAHDNLFDGQIMDVIGDLATSGTLDETNEVTHQFADHFEKVTTSSSGPKWIARFCKAYAAHGM